jgi:hypothetical protein
MWKKSAYVLQLGSLYHFVRSIASSIPIYEDSHKEVAKAALVRSSGANQIIEVCSEWDACTWRGIDVDAVALPVAVVAEVYACCCALRDGKIRSWGGEGGGRES